MTNLESRVARLVEYVESLEASLGLGQSETQEELPLNVVPVDFGDEPQNLDEQVDPAAHIGRQITDALRKVAGQVDLTQVQPMVVTSLDQLRDLPEEAKREARKQIDQLQNLL